MTFLFTDVEGSTLLWERDAKTMRAALESHDRVMRATVDAHAGVVFATGGDGFAVAFARAGDAVAAAVDAQASLSPSDGPTPIQARMGIHTGEAVERGGNYFGPTVNRAARLTAAAHGGQVLLSAVTASLVAGQMPAGSGLRDLGEHRLRDLSEPEHVFQLVHPHLRSDFGPVRSLDRYPGNLPVQPTGFVGRDAELAEIPKALELARVVTLCGVGGVGKTRLALGVATELLPRFKDGAWLVELASVGQADVLDEAVAAGLGVHQRPGATIGQSVLDFLREKSLLLILDNCEHVLDEAARFVEAGVGAAPGLRILATSREGLAVPGERVITVPSLELPGPNMTATAALETEAVRLFVERARESNSTFVAGLEDAAPMAELCRRLDGIPLAIELAAARVRGMTPAEITDHLDRRFKLLTRGRRTATTRHQTLSNTIDWSYELLDEPERLVFRRLAIFAGDFGLDAAESIVAGDDLDTFEVLDLLLRLVEKSLIVAEGHGATTRYRLLETIRDYAWERLEDSGELNAVGERHARHFLDLAIEAGTGFEGPDELLYRARVEQDLEDLRAALRWSISTGDTDAALTEVYALSEWRGSLRSPPFGMMALQAAQMPGASEHRLQATALGSVCMTLTQQGAVEEALAMAETAERAAGALGESAEERKLRCRLRGCLATTIAYSGDSDRLVRLARKGLADARALGDRFEIARALILLAGTLGVDQVDEAIRAGEEGLVVAREICVPSYLAWAPMMLAGRLAIIDPARAEQLLENAVRAATLADNDYAKTMATQQLATVQAAQGDHRAAARTLLDMASGARARGDLGSAQSALVGLACTLALFGDDEAALLTGTWVEEHGYRYPDNPTSLNTYSYAAFGVPTYMALRDRQAPEALNSFVQRARSLDQAGIFELARTHVERFIGPDVREVSPLLVEGPYRSRDSAVGIPDEFRRNGDAWLLTYDQRSCRLRDAKGLHYLAALLSQPGREVHVFDLVGGGIAGGGPGETLDTRGKADYRQRLAELEAEVAEAAEWSDSERADRARVEAEAITAELAAAYGLGGRPRSAADPAERARKAVANRIRDSLARIDDAHPDLGRHLRNSVRTGTFCSYQPERPTQWNCGAASS